MLAVALLVRDLLVPTTTETRAAAIGTMIVIFLLSVAPTIEHFADPDGHRIYQLLGGEIFEGALSRGTLPGCVGPDDRWLLGRCGDVPVLSLLNAVLDIINVLAGLGVGALTVGMILCLETRAGAAIEDQAALLATNLQRMRHQLYLSGLVLTFGMFFVTSWMYWPMPLISDAEVSDYSSVVLAAALFTGIYFTLLILSFYLPVALILDGRVRRLADLARTNDQSGEPVDIDNWRTIHGLNEGVSDYIRGGLALAAPILASFAGGLSPISF